MFLILGLLLFPSSLENQISLQEDSAKATLDATENNHGKSSQLTIR